MQAAKDIVTLRRDSRWRHIPRREDYDGVIHYVTTPSYLSWCTQSTSFDLVDRYNPRLDAYEPVVTCLRCLWFHMLLKRGDGLPARKEILWDPSAE